MAILSDDDVSLEASSHQILLDYISSFLSYRATTRIVLPARTVVSTAKHQAIVCTFSADDTLSTLSLPTYKSLVTTLALSHQT